MNIHDKINQRMQYKVGGYLETIKCNPRWPSRDMILFPSNLKYGGWRNTCYDFRKV